MKIVYDKGKDTINREKHGISLERASELDWDAALSWPDNRQDYGEERTAALVPLSDRLYFVAFTDRSDERRIITLRKANNREVRRYVEES